MDAHYTPSTVANLLVRAARDAQPRLIADLAAGNGDLLFEAERIWPRAAFVATDIDPVAVRRLARLRPSWTVGRCDLRSARSRAACHAIRALSNPASLMLLNPPFTCRGATRYIIPTPQGPLRASTAMSFLLLAAQYVADTGQILSVLPANCPQSEKDQAAWMHVQARYDVHILDNCATGTFPGSTATTVLVRLAPTINRTSCHQLAKKTRPPSSDFRVAIIRGTCPIHRHTPQHHKPPLVHYTDIRNGVVHLNGRRGFGSYRCVQGPAIVLPASATSRLTKSLFWTTYLTSCCQTVLSLSSQPASANSTNSTASYSRTSTTCGANMSEPGPPLSPLLASRPFSRKSESKSMNAVNHPASLHGRPPRPSSGPKLSS